VTSGREDLVGQTLLGKLRVLRKIGSGGYGAVYEVEHELTHNRHALKVLHAGDGMHLSAAQRLIREAGVAGRVGSPRLVQTLDVGQLADGRPYILMELLEGRTWRALLREQRVMQPADAVRFAREVCEGLGAAHAAGIVHRDLKPANVLLVGARGRETVKLLDFGLAKNLPGYTDRFGALTATRGVVGTPHYIAPEQGRGAEDVDGRADQYSLGVMLYESLSGTRPFGGPNVATLISQILEGDYEPMESVAPRLPSGLADIVHRAMHRDRSERFPSAEALRRALEPFEHERGSGFAQNAGAEPGQATAAMPAPAADERLEAFPDVGAVAWAGSVSAAAEPPPAREERRPSAHRAPASSPAAQSVSSRPSSSRSASSRELHAGQRRSRRAIIMAATLAVSVLLGAFVGGLFFIVSRNDRGADASAGHATAPAEPTAPVRPYAPIPPAVPLPEATPAPSPAPRLLPDGAASSRALTLMLSGREHLRCLQNSEQVTPTANVLELRLACAREVECWDTYLDSCNRLPDHNERFENSCRNQMRLVRRMHNGADCRYTLPAPPRSGPVGQ